jgi:uncharacterized protein (DUF302 family)
VPVSAAENRSIREGDFTMRFLPTNSARVFVLVAALLGAVSMARAAGNPPAPQAAPVIVFVPTVTHSTVDHYNFTTRKSFEAVTAAIEKQLGTFDAQAYAALMKSSLPPAEVEAKIHAMEGSSGFMLFAVRDHGQLLALKGKKASVKQYEIGNPLIAVAMTQWDVRAGEYAPLRICVYVGEDHLTHVDYDSPTSTFGRFDSWQVLEVAKGLDDKLRALVGNALKD